MPQINLQPNITVPEESTMSLNPEMPLEQPESTVNLEAPMDQPMLTGLSREEMQKNLDQLYQQVKSKERQVNSRKLMDKNSLRIFKMKLIQQFFDFFKNQGIDLNDLGSINKFLGQLQAQDPDLFALFEMAFSGLMQDESAAPAVENASAPEGTLPVEPPVEPGLDQRFKNIQEQMIRNQ